MSGAAHTPGPWSYDPENGEIRAHGGVIADTCTSDFTSDQDEPNARLMAAAPDLLEALRRIVKPAPGVTQKAPAWVYGIANAAIAKAEGRS